MNKLAYENQSLIDFRKENTAKINKLFATILWYSNIVGVFLIIFSLIGFFDTSIKFCIIVELLSLSFSLIQSLTTKYVKNQRYLMFQGIVLISSLIGFLSINNTVGIYISYGLVSFISCLYLEEKVTVFAVSFSYFCMAIPLFFRGMNVYQGQNIKDMIFVYYIPTLLGYTLEFAFVFLFAKSISKQFSITIGQIKEKSEKISKIQDKLITAFADTAEMNDPTTGTHVKRTSQYVKIISNHLVKNNYYTEILDKDTIRLYAKAAPLHDIGKFCIPNNLLTKPGKYTPEEFEEMKKHAQGGYELIVKEFLGLEEEKFVSVASKMAYFHHERWDGTGYPIGLAGEAIPLCARIMAAADVLDALLSERQYKPAFTLEETLKIIEDSRDKHFESCIVDAVLDSKQEIEKILKSK
jgi:hypothetical protein